MSKEIQENLLSLEEFQRAKVIASYVSMPDEVQTQAIIRSALREGKRVLVPITQSRNRRLIFSKLLDYDDELTPGHFGILEPKTEFVRPTPLDDAEVVLVPVVAWDDRGFRIGYGKGYYDRALERLPKALTVGLALEAQRVPKIPEDKYDIPLKKIVTEKRILQFD